MLNYEYAPDPYLSAGLSVRSAAACSLCGDELFVGQCCYHLGASLVCDRCLPRYARAYFSSCRVRLCLEPNP